MEICLFFTKADTFYGKAIRKVTQSEFSHVGIGYQKDDGTYRSYQALNRGFVMSDNIGYYIDNPYVEIVRLNVKNLTKQGLNNIARQYVGNGYDYLSILNILAIKLLGEPLLSFTGTRRLICSEAVAIILKLIGVANLGVYYDKKEDYIIPQEIYDYFTK